MNRTSLIIGLVCGHLAALTLPANAGTGTDILDRLITLEQQVRDLQTDTRGAAARLDENDTRDAALARTVEDDGTRLIALGSRASENASRLNAQADRLDIQASRLAGHDARLDLIPRITRCLRDPLPYRYTVIRDATVLVRVKPAKPIGYRAGVVWLARIDATCVKGLS